MNRLSDEELKRIVSRRDPRYDGRFYVGVRTTKIYCRPVCPARPKPENIVILRSPSEAEKAGFRPCLRCTPDRAPGSRLAEGTMNTVSRALRLIENWEARAGEEALDVETLAGALGLTDRHLRRLFDEHLGASPIEILSTRRLHLAKQLVTETARPIAEIALGAGFRSLRRFNEAFRARFHAAPSEARKAAAKGARAEAVGETAAIDAEDLSLSLHIRAPYDWTNVLAYLGRHEAYGLERVDAEGYRRFMPRKARGRGEGAFGSVLVARGEREDRLALRFRGLSLVEVRVALGKLRRLFDIEHNPAWLAAEAGGIRVPGGFEGFETAVSIILSQLVSSEQAKAKLKALILRHGRKLGADGAGDVYAFPEPRGLRAAPLEELGMPKVKAGAIRELARLVDEGRIELSPSADLARTRAALAAVRGIGPWTTEMIAMRCLGDADAFPSGDLIVRRAIESGVADESAWRSSRAYLTHAIWRDFGEALSKAKKKTKGKHP